VDSLPPQPALPLCPLPGAGTRGCASHTVPGLEPLLSETTCLKTANSLDAQFEESQLAAVHKGLCGYCDYD